MKHLLLNLCLVICAGAFAQCPGDDCYNPIELTAPGLGETVCAVEVCTGATAIAPNGDTFVEWVCGEENLGNTCWSENVDYWIRLTVTETLPYVLTVEAQNTNILHPDYAGVQMAMYDGCTCPVAWCWDQQDFDPVISHCSDVSQTQMFDLILEPGDYLIQIDGYGTSFGCSEFCVWSPGFLGLGVPELVNTPDGLQVDRDGVKYDLLGRRIK